MIRLCFIRVTQLKLVKKMEQEATQAFPEVRDVMCYFLTVISLLRVMVHVWLILLLSQINLIY